MRKINISLAIIFALIFFTHTCHAGFLDNIMKMFGGSSQEKTDESTIMSALKEAISIGANNAVDSLSKVDGYFGNQAVKILMPEKIKMIADGLKKIGYQKPVDDFILSMNRSAEKAAPAARTFFVDAIKKMTFEDARDILNGEDTAASDYFKKKTYDKLYTAFKPVISSKMNDVGATRYYKDMISKFSSLPFLKPETLDLDHYVTNEALNGLFYRIGEEEKKIRADPKARVTELLKKIFGK